MLRGTTLIRNLRFNYNNFNNWRRYHKDFEVPVEKKELKKSFEQGDKPQFMYDNKIIWPNEYKPWKSQYPFEYAIGFVLILLYLDYRKELTREN